jgi:hypothetical protein
LGEATAQARSSRTLTECGWDTNDEARAKLFGEVDLVTGVALVQINVGDRVTGFDHDCG